MRDFDDYKPLPGTIRMFYGPGPDGHKDAPQKFYPFERLDEILARLEAAGFCRPDPVQWGAILRDDAKRRAGYDRR